MSDMTNRDCQLVITGPFGRIDLTSVRDWREWDTRSTLHTSEGETTTHSGLAGMFRTDRDTPAGTPAPTCASNLSFSEETTHS